MRLSPEGAAFVERLYVDVARSLSPMTNTVAGADQRRLRTLLEHMLDGA